MAASGWLISWAMEAASSPKVVTRATRASSAGLGGAPSRPVPPNRRRDVGGDTTVTEEAAGRVKQGPATRRNVDHRSIGGRGPVDEAVKRLVCFERRDMQTPLLGILRDVGGEGPPRDADPADGAMPTVVSRSEIR